jgi:predicted RNA methylase
VTFLDPAFGGGQFLMEIERRLRAAGHSDENIADRVWGVEERNGRLNYAKRYNQVISNHLIAGDFLTHNWGDMKFDVVVGNPPFQNQVANSDSALWLKFVNTCMPLLNKDGCLLFVTPTSWVGKTTNTKKANWSPFTDNHVVMYHSLNAAERKKFFGDIGSTFGYYLIKKGSGITSLVLDDRSIVNHQLIPGEPLPKTLSQTSMSLHQKLSAWPKFVLEQNFKFHSQVLKAKGWVKDSQTNEFPYPTYYSHNLIRYSNHQQDIYKFPKVMIPNVGILQNAWVGKNCNITEDISFFRPNTMTQGRNMVKLLNSKLFRYIGRQYRSGRNLGQSLKFLPQFDLGQLWSDEQIYQQLNLSQQEIELVEYMSG